nr:putative disease resistance protein [Quercus suber]
MIDEGALPLLEILSIGLCLELKVVPSGIYHLRSLKELRFHDMPQKFEESLDPKQGQRYWIVEHVPIVYLTHKVNNHFLLSDANLNQLAEIVDKAQHYVANQVLQILAWFAYYNEVGGSGGRRPNSSVQIEEDQGFEEGLDEGALPLLENLEFGPSPKLKEVPFGIHHLRNLKRLRFYDMSKEFEDSLNYDVGPCYWIVEHIPAIFLSYKVGAQHGSYDSRRLHSKHLERPRAQIINQNDDHNTNDSSNIDASIEKG